VNLSAEHHPIYSLAEHDVEPLRIRALDFAVPKTPCALALDPGNSPRRRAGASPSPLLTPTPSTLKPRRGDAGAATPTSASPTPSSSASPMSRTSPGAADPFFIEQQQGSDPDLASTTRVAQPPSTEHHPDVARALVHVLAAVTTPAAAW